MKTLLETMDLFAHQISFNYRKKKVFNSFFGISLSFILYGLMLYLLYYFSIDFIKSTNPKVTYRETEFDYTQTFPIDNIITKFTLYIQLNESLYAESSLDQFISENNNTDFLSGIVKMNLVTKNSPNEYLKVNIQTTSTEMVKFDCYNGYAKVCLYLGFFWDAEQLNILNITKLTVGLTENQTFTYNEEALPFEKNEMLKFEAGTNVNLLLGIEFQEKFYSKLFNHTNIIHTEFEPTDNIINTNVISFFKKYTNSHQFNFSPKNMDKELDYYELMYRMVRVRDDRGIIFSSLSDNVRMQKDNIYTKKTNHNEFVGIQIASISFDNVMKHYDRVYRKLQNIFADIGGIFNSFMLIGNLIVFQFNNKKFNYDLINYLFHPDDQEQQQQRENEEFKIKKDLVGFINNVKLNDEFKTNDFYRNVNKDDFSVISNTENNLNFRKGKISNDANFFEMKYTNSNNRLDPNFKIDKRLSKVQNIDMNNNLKFSTVNENKNCINEREIAFESSRFKDLLADNSSISKNIKNENEIITNDKQLEERIKKYLKHEKDKKKKFIKFSRSEFFKLFLCCKNFKSEDLLKKEKIFNSAESKIIDYFDILTYTRFHEEFEKLKSIIFDQYQLCAFEFAKNRQISEILRINLTKGVLDSVKEFKIKSKKGNFNELDKKLFYSFNKEFISYINS